MIWRKPGDSAAIHPFVFPGDTGIFVNLLVKAPSKQNLLGVSEMASYQTFVEVWTEVTGIRSETQQSTVEEDDARIPGGLGREAAESNATSAEFGWGMDLVLPTQVSQIVSEPFIRRELITGMQLDPNFKTTSLREYIQNEDWSEWLAKRKKISSHGKNM
jgi:hypothetical protein